MQREFIKGRFAEKVAIVTGGSSGIGHSIVEELCKEGASVTFYKLVKGIRRIIQFEEDMEFCLKPDFVKGVKLLAEYDLTFDICISYKHNKNILKFLDLCGDEVQFILDHIGKPNIKGRILEPWTQEIKQMAGFKNLFCKVSSLATEADHNKWTIEDIKPYADCIFQSFGFDRVVFAGDWPVSSLAAGLPKCVETIEELVRDSATEDIKKLFHDNAMNFYKV